MSNEMPVRVRIAAIDRLSKVVDKVKGKFPELTRAASRTNTMFGIFQKTTEKFSKSVKKVGDSIAKVGKAMTIGITAPVLAAAAFSVKKFMDIEEALTDVKGATNLSSAELKEFGTRIQNVSKRVPVSQEALLELAAAAGEAGVRGVDNLEKFSVTLAMLAKTAGIKGDEAAESIARILQLTGEGPGMVENFGSAITALGDQYGVSANKVLESTFAITREISKFGISSAQAAGLAAAMEPLGFNAKQASGAVGDAFRGIDEALRKGGKQMQGLQAITGMTGEELKTQFAKNPQAVFSAFLTGLNKIKANGGPTGDALKFFGASGEKTQIILEALAKDTGKLNEIMNFSGQAFKDNTALTGEYEEATATFASKMTLLNNNVIVLAQKVGEQLAPAIGKFADIVIGIINFLDAHPTFAKMIAIMVGLAAVLGPILLAFGTFLTILPGMITGFGILTSVMAGFGITSFAALLPIILIIGKFILIGALIVGLVAVIWKFRDAIWNGIVAGLTAVWKILTKINPLAAALDFGFKKFFGDKKVEVAGNVQNTVSPQGQAIAPQGAALGGIENVTRVNPEVMTQTNNARVDINVRAPQSTSVVGESQGGFLNINRGLAGAF